MKQPEASLKSRKFHDHFSLKKGLKKHPSYLQLCLSARILTHGQSGEVVTALKAVMVLGGEHRSGGCGLRLPTIFIRPRVQIHHGLSSIPFQKLNFRLVVKLNKQYIILAYMFASVYFNWLEE